MGNILSIIIPCYNDGKYLSEAVESIYQYEGNIPFEVIIVNDGSDDIATLRILEDLKKRNIKVINQSNKGLASARNSGVQNSNGKYLLFLDADNKIRPVFISKGIKVLEANNKIGILYGDALFFGEENHILKPGSFNLKRLLAENYIDACVLMRKEVWINTGGYDPLFSILEDWDINLNAAALGWKFYYLPEILFEYRVRKDSILRSHPDVEAIKNKIAEKHGALYRKEISKTIRIKDKLISVFSDLVNKFTNQQ